MLGLQLRCDLTLYPYPDLCHSSVKQPAGPRGVSGGFRSGGVGCSFRRRSAASRSVAFPCSLLSVQLGVPDLLSRQAS